ncbi:MAG: hypothetical protein V1701_02920 [Planctomycetota bacterium]
MPNPLGQRESAAIPELNASLIWKKEPRYDSFLFTGGVAGPAIVPFFQVQKGQAGSGFAVAKSDAETNLGTPGKIGKPNQFLLYGFTVSVLQGVPVADAASSLASDWAQIYNAAVFRFVLGGNTQLEIPLAKIPTGMGPTGFAAQAGGVASTPLHMSSMTNGIPQPEYYYSFTVPGSKLPLLIQGDQPFRCEIGYPLAVVTTVAGRNTRLRCYMHGVYGAEK